MKDSECVVTVKLLLLLLVLVVLVVVMMTMMMMMMMCPVELSGWAGINDTRHVMMSGSLTTPTVHPLTATRHQLRLVCYTHIIRLS